MSTTTPAMTTCQTCGTEFPYEPILLMGRDLGRTLVRECEPCQASTEKAEEERRQAQEQIRRRAAVIAALPPEFLPLEFDSEGTDPYHPEFPLKIYSGLRQWRPGPRGNCLGLYGPGGFCKSRMLTLLAARFILLGFPVTWTTAIRLQNAADTLLKSTDRQARGNAEQHLTECRHAPFLFIDDLGKNEWTRSFETRLFEILDHRRNYRLPIAWSSNAHPEEFANSITQLNADPIIRRLIDRTLLIPVNAETCQSNPPTP